MSRPLTHRLRNGLAVVGALCLVAAGVATTAEAAGQAKPLLTGAGNKATKSTSLTNKGKGPALKLKVKKGPALSVNTQDLVTNLNADSVDGLGAADLAPAPMTFRVGTPGAHGTGSVLFQTRSVPAGTYEFTIWGVVNPGGPTDSAFCIVANGDPYLASGASDQTAIWAGGTALADSNAISGSGFGTVPAGGRVLFMCGVDPAGTYLSSVEFTLRKVPAATPVPGVVPFTP